MCLSCRKGIMDRNFLDCEQYDFDHPPEVMMLESKLKCTKCGARGFCVLFTISTTSGVTEARAWCKECCRRGEE